MHTMNFYYKNIKSFSMYSFMLYIYDVNDGNKVLSLYRKCIQVLDSEVDFKLHNLVLQSYADIQF